MYVQIFILNHGRQEKNRKKKYREEMQRIEDN